MTSHHARTYTVALTLVVFFLAWAVIAARPWAAPAADPRLRAVAARETRLRHEVVLVRKVVAARWAAYHARLTLRRVEIARARAAAARVRAQAAAAAAAARASAAAAAAVPVASAPSAPSAPAVRVVTLPPLTVTRTS
jgi:hypothetical protein